MSAAANVALTGKWQAADHDIVIGAVEAVAGRLGERLGLPAGEAFNRVFFAGVIFQAVSTARGGHWGYAAGRVVQLVRGKVGERLVVHELGHVYQYVARRRFGWSASPCGVLSRTPQLSRSIRVRAPANGYVSDNWRDGWQMHPSSMAGGDRLEEDWADMWLNWVYRSFVDNERGAALYDFVERQVGLWEEELATDAQIRIEEELR